MLRLQISDIKDFYKYLKNALLPTLKPSFWYGMHDGGVSKIKTANGEIYAVSSPGPNGTKVYRQVHPYPQGYTADRANAWLVGIPRIRQLRVIDSKCEMKSIHPFPHRGSPLTSKIVWR